MTEAGEIHSRAWIPPSIHNAGEFDFPLLILITYLADYFFFIVDYIFLSFFFISFLFFSFFSYLERPSFDGMTDGDDGTNVGESFSQVIEVTVNILESVVTGPFHSMTWRVYLQDYLRGCTFGVLGRDVKIFRSVDSETWTLGLIDRSDWFFTNKCSNETRLELFWINEAGCARMRLTPKLPRATDTVHASYRITKRTRTWIFTWPDRDSLPPSVTS